MTQHTIFRFSSLLSVVTMICMILVLFSACQDVTTTDQLLSESELLTCELFVHNVTCSDELEQRTVEDDTFKETVISLCKDAAPFRPIISYDVILGTPDHPFFTLENSTTRYMIGLFDVEKMISLDYIYRDAPMIKVAISEINEYGSFHKTSGWYCTLSATNYALLLEAIQTYTGGEIRQ